jgi:hypothetical protein
MLGPGSFKVRGSKQLIRATGGTLSRQQAAFRLPSNWYAISCFCIEIAHFFHMLTLRLMQLQDPGNEDYATECEELCKKLTHAQSSSVLSVVNEQHLAVEHGLTIDADKVAENIFFIKGTLRYDCDKLSRFGAEARRLMKESFARCCNISFKDVLIERVLLCSERKLKVKRLIYLLFHELSVLNFSCTRRLTTSSKLKANSAVT